MLLRVELSVLRLFVRSVPESSLKTGSVVEFDVAGAFAESLAAVFGAGVSIEPGAAVTSAIAETSTPKAFPRSVSILIFWISLPGLFGAVKVTGIVQTLPAPIGFLNVNDSSSQWTPVILNGLRPVTINGSVTCCPASTLPSVSTSGRTLKFGPHQAVNLDWKLRCRRIVGHENQRILQVAGRRVFLQLHDQVVGDAALRFRPIDNLDFIVRVHTAHVFDLPIILAVANHGDASLGIIALIDCSEFDRAESELSTDCTSMSPRISPDTLSWTDA